MSKLAAEMTDTPQKTLDDETIVKLLSKAQATIWFKPDGTILDANPNFCNVMGYRLDEIVGAHHRIFVEPKHAASEEYADFWHRLARGEVFRSEYLRIGKGGRQVYIDASYAPVRNAEGEVVKVFKMARDITQRRARMASLESQLDAILRFQAVIEFELDGTITSANKNFLDVMGYELGEIVGKKHSMFVDAEFGSSPDYAAFWRRLRSGEHFASEYRRIGKGGREVWINATYNPVRGPSGQPEKVIKFASDITGSKQRSRNLVRGVNEVSASILEEAEMISKTSQELSKRNEQQAATVEETARAMKEIAASAEANVKHAEEATGEARAAQEAAKKGSDVVAQAIEAMNKIEDGSKQIRKFIEVIDAIAFQTNLLALNAGVEAARAGDAGRGFAVVASEVRALAQRASDSAKDINALIDANGREVSEGARLVNESGAVLTDITDGVTRLSERIDSIYDASREQASGAIEVDRAISSVDAATQENASISDANAAASATLVRASGELQDLMGQFGRDAARPGPERAA